MQGRSSAPTWPTTPGMTLVAWRTCCSTSAMVKRFHADPTRAGDRVIAPGAGPSPDMPTIQPRPLNEMRVVAPPPATPMRRFRRTHGLSAFAIPVQRQLCDDRDQRRRRQQLLPRHGRDEVATRPHADPGSQFVYLRDIRSGSVWSATHHPTAAEPDDYAVEFRAAKSDVPSPRRRDRHATRRRRLNGRRCGGPQADGGQSERPHPRNRYHQLRGDRPRVPGG